MLKRVNKNQKGFTLVELIVVIAILAVLGTLLIPRIMGNVKDARNQATITDAQTLAGEISIRNAQAISQPISGTIVSVPAILPTTPRAIIPGDLPSDMTVTNFPSSSIVEIIVDTSGNAKLDIK